MAGNYEEMLDYYPLLIESAIDFKIESRKILATHNGKLAVTLSRVVSLGVCLIIYVLHSGVLLISIFFFLTHCSYIVRLLNIQVLSPRSMAMSKIA